MAEPEGLRFDAVHQDNADAREGVYIQFADRLRDQILPGEVLPFERRTPIVKQVDGHEVSFGELDGWLKKALRRRLALDAEDQLLRNMVLGREERNGIQIIIASRNSRANWYRPSSSVKSSPS
jgi:hypothetical protein